MSITDWGTFTRYTPSVVEQTPAGTVLYLRNEAGEDWYEKTKDLAEGATLVELNADGSVFGWTGRNEHQDYRSIWPEGRRVLEVRPTHGGLANMKWDGNAFVPAPARLQPVLQRVQLAQGFAERGAFSEQEAEDWVATGTLPPAMLAVANAMADPFHARLALRGNTSFIVDEPVIVRVIADLVPGGGEEFWRHCATL